MLKTMRFYITFFLLAILISIECRSQGVVIKLDTLKINYQEREDMIKKSVGNDSLYKILKKTGRLEASDGTISMYAASCLLAPKGGKGSFIKRAKDYFISYEKKIASGVGSFAKVSFTISRRGELQDATIISIKGSKSIAPIVLKFLESEEPWSIGICSGYPISASYLLTVNF